MYPVDYAVAKAVAVERQQKAEHWRAVANVRKRRKRRDFRLWTRERPTGARTQVRLPAAAR